MLPGVVLATMLVKPILYFAGRLVSLMWLSCSSVNPDKNRHFPDEDKFSLNLSHRYSSEIEVNFVMLCSLRIGKHCSYDALNLKFCDFGWFINGVEIMKAQTKNRKYFQNKSSWQLFTHQIKTKYLLKQLTEMVSRAREPSSNIGCHQTWVDSNLEQRDSHHATGLCSLLRCFSTLVLQYLQQCTV